MFSKRVRYVALVLAFALVLAWILSLFFRKDESEHIKKIIESSADSIEYAKSNISVAQKRIDSLVLKIDSVNNVILSINQRVNKGAENLKTTLYNSNKLLNELKQQVVQQQSEIDKLRQQLINLK